MQCLNWPGHNMGCSELRLMTSDQNLALTPPAESRSYSEESVRGVPTSAAFPDGIRGQMTLSLIIVTHILHVCLVKVGPHTSER